MRKFAAMALLFLVFSATVATAQTEEQNIRTLLTTIGADKLAIQVIDVILPQFQKLAPEVPEKFWQKFRSSVNVQSLVDLLIPIYMRHYTNDDILQLIAFYKTPVGQKLIQETPSITKESFAAGQEWGKQIARKIFKELNDAGYKVSEASAPANSG